MTPNEASLWQRAPESSLDPRNPNGPVTFTSTALLGVAYVRLGLDIGSYKYCDIEIQSRLPTSYCKSHAYLLVLIFFRQSYMQHMPSAYRSSSG
ncbi:hypothetical protein N7501_008560 [Penicillium viridicatum]|nr:hypothetical protein N7501_008560 [Penicillium viridicatum]